MYWVKTKDTIYRKTYRETDLGKVTKKSKQKAVRLFPHLAESLFNKFETGSLKKG